jgi:glucose/arabinose dehydrogenase
MFQGCDAAATSGPHAPKIDPTVLSHTDIRPENLPKPFATPSAQNMPNIVPQPAGAKLVLPPGFSAEVWAEGGFQLARWVTVAPNGDVFVADSEAGKLVLLRDRDEDGKAETRFEFGSGLNQPFGMAFADKWLYVGNTDAVVRFPYTPGQTAATAAPEKIADLPGRGYREHWTRNVVVSPDGSRVYATVGSESNVEVEPDPRRAAIIQMNPDGSESRVFANGTRNPIGLAFNPTTGALWAAVQERDGLGDDLAPDFVTEVKDGAFYGWPFAYAGQNEDPRRLGERPDLVKKTVVPDVLVQAHSAVLGLVFYTGKMFPPEYRGDAFVALHGSWNRSRRTGYKIIRIKFKDGRPVGGYDDFVSGWMLDEESRDVWGRPVGLAVLPDGSMLIVDDGWNRIWRVTYSGKA